MSAAPNPGRGRPPLREVVGLALAAGAVAWAYVAHQGFGPDQGDAWYQPSGFLLGAFARLPFDQGMLPSLAMPALPALGLCIGAFLLTRSAVARTLAVASVIASACFGFYGTLFTGPWDFFEARWSGTLVLFSASVGAALCAVLLARSWRELPAWAQVATYLPVAAVVLGIERNVTGTNPDLAFAISPWPAAQVFGLELLATSIGFVILGAGAGLFVFARGLERIGRLPALVVGAVVGIALPPLALLAGTRLDALALNASPAVLRTAAGAAALTLIAAGALLVGQPARLAQRARLFWLGAGLVLLPLVAGQVLARWDYSVTRDRRAQAIIEGLEAYEAGHDAYPDELEELVAAGYLESVPEPRVGFRAFGRPEFTYQNFGMSYLLEFSSPRWIQCAYNPPYGDEEDFEDEELAEEDLGGSWSCPSKPPDLW